MKQVFTRKSVKISAIVLAVLVLGAIAVTALIPADFIRGKLAAGFGERIGREVSIDGPFNVRWRWGAAHVTAEKVRISNAPQSKDKDMLKVEKADLRIRLWPLLLGNIVIPEATLDKPEILLEKYEADSVNWKFMPLSPASAVKEAAVPDNRREMPDIGVLRIRNGHLVFRDMPRKLELDLQLDLARASEKETFSFAGKGKLDGKELDVKGEGGSLEMLRDSSKEYPLALEISMAGTKVKVAGTFRDPVKAAGLNAMMDLSGPNLADLFHLTHIPFPPTPAYTLKGQLIKEGEKWQFRDFAGKTGESDLSGNVAYDTSGERSLFSGKVNSQRLDVEDLGGFVGATPRAKKVPGKLLPDVPLDLTRLRATDVDVTLHADKLNAPGWPLSDMDARFQLTNGFLKVDPLRFGIAGGQVDGSIKVEGREEVPDVALALDLKKLSVRQFLRSARLGDLSTGTFGGEIRLTGKGKTLADMLAASNGRITLIMTGGRISLTVVEAADLDIAELIPLILGEDRSTQLRCAAGDFAVNSGRLNSRFFVIDTADTKFKADADINLKNEKMDIKVDAKPKDGSILSLQSGIVVRGTFKNPDVGIDMAEAGARGGVAAAAAVLNPLAAIIPFVEFGGGEHADCKRLFELTEEPPPRKAEK